MKVDEGEEDVRTQCIMYLGRSDEKQMALGVVSDNQDYSWYSNWRLVELDQEPERNEDYKAIGEEILDIESEYDLDDNDISAEMEKWIAAVGEGDWGATEGAYYGLVKVKTQTKVLDFGTEYNDCHYPSTLWDVE